MARRIWHHRNLVFCQPLNNNMLKILYANLELTDAFTIRKPRAKSAVALKAELKT